MIRFERVSKRYPNGREALSDLNFEIADGEMVFLTGRSGAGKSSVLKLIALLERPTRGIVLVNGENTAPSYVFDLSSAFTVRCALLMVRVPVLKVVKS